MDSLKLSDIKTIANIGAGTMGHATALQFAMYGYHVYLLDTTQKALNHGLDLIKHDLQTFLGANIVQADEETDILARIIPTTDYQKAISKADFVIESIVEDLTVKQLVWQKVEQFASDETVFATNTSGLSPTAIQSKLHHPERLIVAHFWNPAQLMPLVEVVPGNLTNEATITLTTALMNHVGKHAIALKRESLGFVGNRIQLAVLREAFKIVKDGIAGCKLIPETTFKRGYNE